MFDPTSRYYVIENATLRVTDSSGIEREIVYKKRRFLPTDLAATTLVEHTVKQGDRLDNITAHYLGDPTQFWRVCDTNNVIGPDELEESGRAIRIDLPHI